MKSDLFLTIALLLFFSQIGMTDNSPILVKKAKPNFDSIQTVFQKLQGYQEIVITADFDSLIANRRTDVEQLAKVEVRGKGQPDLAFNLKIRLRGRFRRMKCDIPPMRLNFEKPVLKALNLYQKYDKLKLVTHCSTDATNAQALLKEYWTYKLYNEVTENSFRVHLLKVSYVDKKDASNKMESYAFIIENSAEMAHRLNGELVEGLGILPSALAPNTYHDVLMFNYMIGNTDWQLKFQKNLKLVKHPNSDLYTIVPYDFDFAKIVEPSYMRKDAKLDINNRVAMDTFTDKASLDRCLNKFQRLRKTGFTHFNKCDKLTAKEKSEMTTYIKSFYKKTKKQQQFEALFLAKN